MPYEFIANAAMVSHRGITIYHVYRNNFNDGGWRDYWFSTNEYGCEDDDDAFDIRDKAGYNSELSPAANLVNMIENSVFGPVPEDYDHYINEDDSTAGRCPVCGSSDLDYGSLEVMDECIRYPFTCKLCGVSGNEYASLSFNGFSVD